MRMYIIIAWVIFTLPLPFYLDPLSTIILSLSVGITALFIYECYYVFFSKDDPS